MILLSSLGVFLELYDFSIFGFYALYFAEKIFPIVKSSALIYTFSIFALGYCMKPLGIYIFQKIYFKISLSKILICSIFIMALCFLTMATIPTYDSIGVWSGIIMLFSRLLQGVAGGIEMQCIIKFISGNITSVKRRFAINGIWLGVGLGIFLGVLLNRLLIQYLNDFELENWGWRIPFYLGSILSLLCCTLRINSRNSKVESNIFRNKITVFTIFKRYKWQILTISGIISITASLLVSSIIFMPIYLHSALNLDYLTISNILFKATIISLSVSFIAGLFVKIISPCLFLYLCYFAVIPASVLSYSLLASGEHLNIAVYILATFYSLFAKLIPIAIPKNIFPAHFRLTSSSIATHIGFIFMGSIHPLIISLLLTFSHSIFIAPCLYIITVACMGIICLILLPKLK